MANSDSPFWKFTMSVIAFGSRHPPSLDTRCDLTRLLPGRMMQSAPTRRVTAGPGLATTHRCRGAS
jgi:hypothetical protein